MKKIALVSALVLGLAITPAAQARQLATFDASNAANTLGTLNQLKDQALQLKAQYDKMQETLGVAKDAYNAVSHGPESALNYLGAKLNVPELRQAIGDVQDLRSALNGGNVAGDLGALANDFLERNRVYSPTDENASSVALETSAKNIAKEQAVADKFWKSASTHIESLQEIEGQLATAKDTKAVADIQARLQAETAYLQAQQIQLASAKMMQEAEERNRHQQANEKSRKQLDEALAAVRARINQ